MSFVDAVALGRLEPVDLCRFNFLTGFHQLTDADVTDTVLIPLAEIPAFFPNGASHAHPLRTPTEIL